jgi:hypothetical protein
MKRRNNQLPTPPTSQSTCPSLYNYFQVLQEEGTDLPHQGVAKSPAKTDPHEAPKQAYNLSQASPTVTRLNATESRTSTPVDNVVWEMPKQNGRPSPRATPAPRSKNRSQIPRDRSQPSLLQCYNNLPQLTPPAVSCELSVIRHDSESQSTTGTLRRATLPSHPARTTSTQSERVSQQASPLSQTRTDTTRDQIDSSHVTMTAIALQHDHTTSPDCLATERTPHVSGSQDIPHYQREPTAATPRATPRRQAKLFQPTKPQPPEESITQAARHSQPPGTRRQPPRKK